MRKMNLLTRGIALVCLAAVGLAGCRKNLPEQPRQPEGAKLALSTETLDFPIAGGTQTVTVTGSNWAATPSADWIVVAADGGSFTVTVGANESPAQRSGSVTVTNADEQKTLTVSQTGDPDAVGVGTDELFFIFEGGTQTVSVTSNATWAATPSADWIIVTKTGTTGFSVRVNAYNAEQPRTGTITVDNGKRQKTITVTQEEHLGIEMAIDATHNNGTATTSTMLFNIGNAWDNGSPLFQRAGLYLSSYITMPVVSHEKAGLDMTPGIYTLVHRRNDNEPFTGTLGIQNVIKNPDADNYIGGSMIPWESGTIEVAGDHKGYTIKVKVTLEDGSLLKAYSRQPMIIDNPAKITNIYEDYTLLPLTQGNLGFRGDFIGNGTYLWALQVYSDGIYKTDVGQLLGNGNLVQIYLISDQSGDGTVMPDGEYTILNLPTAADYPAFSVESGYGFWDYGSWINEMTDGWIPSAGIAPLHSGKITSSYDKTSGVYTMIIDAEDDGGNKIVGTIESELEWFDFTDVVPNPMRAPAPARTRTSSLQMVYSPQP